MENPYKLESLGWNSFFETQLENSELDQFIIARVAIEYKNQYRLYAPSGELQAEPSGNLLFSASGGSALPKVGDWVLAIPYDENKAIIQRVLERKTHLSRKVAGRAVEEQVIASNLDILFIVQGLDDNFNINRLERYVSIVHPGIKPVIVLNKSDQCSEHDLRANAVKKRLPNIAVLTTSALYGDISDLVAVITPGNTAGFVGSSGTGKSTLINRVCGRQLLHTREVRNADSKGRHTTTNRQLIVLENGSVLMDTPGMRELQLWDSGEANGYAFPEIGELAKSCRFRDCTHTVEEGCAVIAALETKELSYEQYRNYLKLRKEEEYLYSLRNDHAHLRRKNDTKRLQRWFNRMKRGG
jgi:ribosome biogenesis GTPase / thiamine phosphate phosphatase